MEFLRVLLVKTSATLKKSTLPAKAATGEKRQRCKILIFAGAFFISIRDGNANLSLTPFWDSLFRITKMPPLPAATAS